MNKDDYDDFASLLYTTLQHSWPQNLWPQNHWIARRLRLGGDDSGRANSAAPPSGRDLQFLGIYLERLASPHGASTVRFRARPLRYPAEWYEHRLQPLGCAADRS